MLAIGPLGIGAAIGLVLGLLGGGGAILAVPGLVYILGVEPHAAIAASLAIVAVGALTGLLVHARQGRVAWATAIQLGLTGVVGSIAGAWLGQLVPGERLLALLGLFMLLAAWLMVRRPSVGDRASPPRWQAPLMGLGLGLLTGFFGVGGGFLIVPALTLGLGLPMRQAIGTSLAVITMNALAGVVGYLGGGIVDWPLTVLVSLGAVGGALVGGRLAGTVPERGLRRGFASMVALIAVYLVYRNATSWIVALVPPGLVS
ncbi:MAG TPA: sulfite exporter TauE/SafE family protein [Chloroflexota bacterium]|nr:sulfite exporter TauE/SafE family protein [Chloroflexota bacterium]